jgi:hypothetical protein
MDGEEIGSIAQAVDQSQLMVDLAAVGRGQAARKHGGSGLLGQRHQRILSAAPGHHLLIGILVADLAQIEGALRRCRRWPGWHQGNL